MMSRDIELVEEIKNSLKILSSDDYKFQRKKHQSMDLITVNIFVKDADCVRPIAHAVKNRDLFIDKVLGEKQVFGRDLIALGEKIMQSKYMER